jgi:glucokinase
VTSQRGPRIGVDVGGTKCLAVAIDDDSKVIAELRLPTPRGDRSVEALITTVVGAIAEIEQLVGDCASIGIGVPGLVTHDGVLRAAPNLDGVIDVEVANLISDGVGKSVVVENDATCGALAEWQAGAARGATDIAFVSLGTGIGGGLITDGVMHRGRHGYAGEFGHIVIDPTGPECPCGQRGCWERYASGSGLVHLAQQRGQEGRLRLVVEIAGGDPARIRSEHVLGIQVGVDGETEDLMSDFARWVALGLVNLAHVVDPEVFIIGGGVGSSLGSRLDSVRSFFVDLIYQSQQRELPVILPAELGEYAGAIGAALLQSWRGDFSRRAERG